MVGGALRSYLEEARGIKPFLYDTGKNLGSIKDVNQADVVFICVPTPFDEKNSYIDLSQVREAISNIGGEKVVVIKSTVLPGFTDSMQVKYPQHKILNNPEFLTEAKANEDMYHPDRQIVGYTDKSYEVAKDVLGL